MQGKYVHMDGWGWMDGWMDGGLVLGCRVEWKDLISG